METKCQSLADAGAEVVAYLNELLELDRPAIAALVANRVPCNSGLALHPTCQVGCQNGGWYVGLLGVLHGLFGIVAVFEDEQGTRGKRLARFEIWRDGCRFPPGVVNQSEE